MVSLPRKHLFDLPNGVIYLDGNSLGPLPRGVAERLERCVHQEWGEMLIRGWNDAQWMDQPARVGNKIAGLIGAPEGSVVIGDTLSIKVYQALASALEMRPDRKVVLSDNGNFPTDLYMAEGLLRSLGRGHELRTPNPEDVADAITEEVAVVMLTQVDYRTGRMHDFNAITQKAHAVGAVMIWDLAHSAGAVPVDMLSNNAEFAVGCTYKYLNGGPGAPAFIYVRPDIADTVRPALSGWLGHEAPFAFDLGYRPGRAVERMRVGTPPVLQATALEEALSVWDGLTMAQVRARSIELSERFIHEVEARCPDLTLLSPRDPLARGSQVSFGFSESYAAIQALIGQGVIGDFRAPDAMRFGFTPLYIDEDDVVRAAEIIEDVMTNRLWDNPAYQARSRVT